MDYDDDDEDEDDYNLDQYWDELLSLTWQSQNGHGGGSRLHELWRQRGWRWRWLQYGPILRYMICFVIFILKCAKMYYSFNYFGKKINNQ